jgi:hypothetical protein
MEDTMSQTFSLVCHETKKRVWVGQGLNKMTVFYSGKQETMEKLKKFLQDHYEKDIVLLCDDTNDDIMDYEEV